VQPIEERVMFVAYEPNDYIRSLIELRSADATRRFRRSIFNDYPLRGPLGQPACAFCGRWHEKLTLDHIVPKSKDGPHFAKWNLAPACSRCNLDKSNMPLFEWWRPKKWWSQEREELLMTWIYVNSFIDAHTNAGEYWAILDDRRVLQGGAEKTVHEERGPCWPPFDYQEQWAAA
jgi:hypothetical protein